MTRLLIIPLVTLLALSCTKQEVDSASLFSVEPTTIEASSLGGNFEVEYILEANNGINPIAVTEAEWIVDIDNSTNGSISFRVLPNHSETPREAVVTLRHISTTETPQFVVRQDASNGEYLTLDITKLDYSECEVTITPHDEDMLYVVTMAEKSYLTGLNITNVEELVAADIVQYNSYIASGDSLEDFLTKSKLAQRGKQIRVWQDLSPAKEYVVYAYGIYLREDEYECVTPVSYALIDKRMPERSEEHFDVNITAEGPEVTFNIEPSTWEGYYMVQLVEDSEAGYIEQGMAFSEIAEEQVAEAFFYIADHLYYFEELSAEEVMQQLGYKGAATFSKTLNANHRYMALIYAIDSIDGNVPMVVSKPIVKYFNTGGVEASDITFTAEFSNIRPRSVDVTITPSKDETYTAVLMYAKNLPAGDKQEQLEWVMQKYAPLELTGTYSEHISQLPPNTEFVLAVYGYYAGAATTDLFLYRFTTLEDGEGTNHITEVRCTAYDLSEVADLEPYYASMLGYGDYLISMEVITEQPSPSLHFDIFRRDIFDEYTEDEIRESLLDYAYTSSPDWALCTYGNEYIICGLAEDENGFVGEMFISEPISFERADVGDASIFVELYKEWVD